HSITCRMSTRLLCSLSSLSGSSLYLWYISRAKRASRSTSSTTTARGSLQISQPTLPTARFDLNLEIGELPMTALPTEGQLGEVRLEGTTMGRGLASVR